MSNYLVSDTDLTSVADAIRTKGGTSASLAFPSGFVSAIGDIPSGGGGDIEFEHGTFTPAANAASVNLTVPFEPTHILVYGDQTEIGLGSTWERYGIVVFDTAQTKSLRPLARTINGGYQIDAQASDTSAVYAYSSGTLTIYASGQFLFGAGYTYTWFAWRETT